MSPSSSSSFGPIPGENSRDDSVSAQPNLRPSLASERASEHGDSCVQRVSLRRRVCYVRRRSRTDRGQMVTINNIRLEPTMTPQRRLTRSALTVPRRRQCASAISFPLRRRRGRAARFQAQARRHRHEVVTRPPARRRSLADAASWRISRAVLFISRWDLSSEHYGGEGGRGGPADSQVRRANARARASSYVTKRTH